MKKILLAIPDDMMRDIDDYCKQYSFERSEFIRSVIRGKIYGGPSGYQPVQPSSTEQGSPNPASALKIQKRYCELHFESGVEYDCRLVSFENENGDVVIDTKWACPKCYMELKNRDYGIVHDAL